MTCYSKTDKDGKRIFLCGDLGPKCNNSACNWTAEFQCDFPIAKGKTCDRYLCEDHAYQVGPDKHYCASHYNQHMKARCKGDNVAPFKTV